jgi:citrate lyase subunit beta/citryl-CoA lyase
VVPFRASNTLEKRGVAITRPTIRLGATSVLFAAGHQDRLLDEAGAAEADLLVRDLEDTVPSAEKRHAREAVRRTIGALSAARRASTFLRPNLGSDGYLREELELARTLAGIVVPKVSSTLDVLAAIAALEQARSYGDGPAQVLIATIETARGVLHAEEIAAADPRIVAVIFGPSDLTLDLGIIGTPTHDELAYPRAHVSLCAAAAGVLAIDGGFGIEDDIEGLTKDALAARHLGYTVKLTTYPGHIPHINRLLSPTDAEIQWASEVVASPGADAVRQSKAELILRRRDAIHAKPPEV